MIQLTRLNHLPLVLNADLIESIEVTPDTVIALTTGQKLVVLETADEVVRRVVEFRRAIYSGVPGCSKASGAAGELADEPGIGERSTHGREDRAGR
ncbi:MAG: flagellar FlbD family protein [Bryobacteraceae bacterium]